MNWICRAGALCLAAVMSLSLAACTPVEGESSPSPSPSAGPDPTPSASPGRLPPVMAAAQVFLDGDIASFEAQPGVSITGSEITALELEGRWPGLLPQADVELWYLTYRLFPADMARVAITGGRETDGQGGITEQTSLGRPYLVLSAAPGGDYGYLGVIWSGEYDPTQEGAADKLVTERACGIENLEYALNREGFAGWYGLGSPDVGFLEGEPAVEPLDYDVTYGEGDYWEKLTWPDLTAEFYVSVEYGLGPSLNRLSTTLPELATYRGISVGASRREVLAAYPEAHAGPIWDFQGEYLWYGDDSGFGPLLFFYFDSDTLSRIELVSFMD